MTTVVMGSLQLKAQQLLDDFNRPADNVVNGFWTETESVANTGAVVNGSGQLALGSTTAGRDYVAQDVSAYYNTTFNSNTCVLTWAFCMRQSRADPSGFANSNYGAAYVLGATSGNLNTVSNGYAIVLGNGGNPDPIRLVRFSGGLQGTQVTVITGTGIAANPGANYMAIRVTFTPATGTWNLYASTLAVGTFSSTNPTAAATAVGSAVNSTYTGTNLPFTGCFWNHATGAGEAALFDNVYIPQLCIPTVNFTAATSLVSEAAGTAVITMNIFPATVTGGDIVITMANGPGVFYGAGGDYTTTPAVVGTDITVTVLPGATTATFTVNLNNDVLDEGNETITYTISSTTNDLIIGVNVAHAETIQDDDGLPSVSFTTTSLTTLECGCVVTFNMNISPAPAVPTAVTVTIQVTFGTGAVYGLPGFGGDLLTNPATAGTTMTLIVPAGNLNPSITASVWDDALTELTENVTFTIVGVSAGFSIGATNSVANLYIGDNDNFPTTLAVGDLVIVGVNANDGCPGGTPSEDVVSFFCFKQIEYGTKIILTDCGWERCIANRWGNTEGVVEMTRTGVAIPAGQVITFRLRAGNNVVGVGPDAAWSSVSLNSSGPLNMNSNGDQIFFMQGGTWIPGTPSGNDAQYTGTVLYGFSTNPAFPWSANCGSTQRSNLPLGMICFTTAPTGASDYNKYTGPLTITTQRNWVIRVDDPANWTSYANCTGYNGAAPNWISAPILPITGGGFVPGLWRGTASSSDWFDCKNWDDARVPITTTNVRIDETANNHCIVGVTAGGNAVCASLVHTNSGAARNLTIQNSSSLAIGGPMTIQRSNAGGLISTTVLGNSTLTATTCTVQGVTPNLYEAVLRNEVPGNTVTFSGNFTIGQGGWVDLNGGAAGGTIYIGGNYLNNGPSEATLDELNGTIAFNGAGAQSVSTTGFQDVFGGLTVSKASGDLNLNDPIALRGVLDLSSGRVNTSASTLLSMRAGSSWTNATDLSFVNGPMEKIGLTNFTFPVGKGSNLRPCGVQGITGVATSAFKAEYFPASAYTVGIPLEPALHHISQCEYWTIDRSASTPNATVVLTWEAPASCGVTMLSELRVARWDDTAIPAPGIWRDRGNGGTTGTLTAGSVPTAASESIFNATLTPWTLASVSANNPLPITLVRFTAEPEGSVVKVRWTTASEFENELFTVERSSDGLHFEPVLDVPGARFSSVPLDYVELDRSPYPGLSYYRLRQTDLNGESTLSQVVAVLFGSPDQRPLVVFGNADVLTAVHGFPAGSRYELMDMTGRLIVGGSTTMDGRTELNGLSLSRGAYLMRLHNGDRVESTRFVY